MRRNKMGFFSWITSDTNRSISNRYSCRETFPVYLLCPDGRKISECRYEGYGVFGGEDAYALLARWNEPEKCTGDDDKDRIVGINLEYNNPDAILYPLKFVEDFRLGYEDVDASDICPDQGFFY